MSDRLRSSNMILPLSKREKMKIEANIHIQKGEALLSAAAASIGPDFSQIYGPQYPRMSPLIHSSSLLSTSHPSIRPSMSMSNPPNSSSVIDALYGLPSTQPNNYSGMGMDLGMGMGIGMGGAASVLHFGADFISAIDRSQLKLELMMIMRRRESMILAEERARAEAVQRLMNMGSAFAFASVVIPGSELDSESTLAALGNSLRKKSSPYVDTSGMTNPPAYDLSTRPTRGGVTEPFPEKLHRMLLTTEKEGDVDIISFFPHGRAFGIRDPERFEKMIMPKYYNQSRLSSFQRQLNLYGFTRIISGSDSGGYYHELFLKGRPALCTHMRRVGIPKGVDRRKLSKSTLNKKEPDFYSMRPSI